MTDTTAPAPIFSNADKSRISLGIIKIAEREVFVWARRVGENQYAIFRRERKNPAEEFNAPIALSYNFGADKPVNIGEVAFITQSNILKARKNGDRMLMTVTPTVSGVAEIKIKVGKKKLKTRHVTTGTEAEVLAVMQQLATHRCKKDQNNPVTVIDPSTTENGRAVGFRASKPDGLIT